MRSFLLLIFALSGIFLSANTVNKDLFIISDSLRFGSGEVIPYTTFNDSESFSENNPVISLLEGDSLSIRVINNDSIVHQFKVKGFDQTLSTVNPGDTVYVGMRFNNSGCYIYYDPLNYPNNYHIGLSGMISVSRASYKSFYWNIKEHHIGLNTEIIEGQNIDWESYTPNYFTINGNSNPEINQDSTARIIGNVGDTIILFVSNTGKSIHSLHFHGYHGEIISSSKNNAHKGRSKDTFPIYPFETLVIQIVPDKPGEYPIHDHNLVAVSGGNVYPNGMFTSILISP